MRKSNYSLKLIHLYPQQMNVYGDTGNITTLYNRCLWRGIDFQVESITYENLKEEGQGDIYFMGGGQDNDMYSVFEDMYMNKKEFISSQVEAGKVFLLICGGFQLFGEYFLDSQKRKIKGLGILPITTKSPGERLSQRCLGDIISTISPELKRQISLYYKQDFSKYLIGFENHSGETYINSTQTKPLAKTIVGSGNNATQKIDGVRYKNIFASYTHGPLLPKNPHFADLLIGIALKNKYGIDIDLLSLDDSIEWEAHNSLLKRYEHLIRS